MFCNVYLQCGIIIQRVVTIHGLPCVQLSRMINLKIELAKNKCLDTIWSTEMIPIACTYPAREHYKKRLFPVTLQFDPHFVHDQFSLTQFRRQITQDV